MQFLYPAHSANPAAQPVGGAEIYFTPLPLMTNYSVTNVTLTYSVFFPVDFDWVKGGKLPGLYGGHRTCSGGDDAKQCFSTRMMWRAEGAGELYLYAPKDKQPPSLCQTPPQSDCNAAYGFSIGRGSFHFARGAWTTIRQSVKLNTPGVQNGGFYLEVNGRPVMDLKGILYREVLDENDDSDDGSSDDGDDNAIAIGGKDRLLGLIPSVVGDVGVILSGILEAAAHYHHHRQRDRLLRALTSPRLHPQILRQHLHHSLKKTHRTLQAQTPMREEASFSLSLS